MEDKFYHKYLKYKNKYLQLKYSGGNLTDFISIFNSNFGSDWILTGSQAIQQYLIYFNRLDLLPITPNDVDIIYINNGLIYKPSINGFTRVQSHPERSMTFKKDSLSFDVSIQNSEIYYEVNSLKLVSPKVMLENYEENLDTDNQKTYLIKINALRNIIKFIEEKGLEKKKLSVSK